MIRTRFLVLQLLLALTTAAAAQTRDAARLERLKTDVAREIDGRARFTQQLVDQIPTAFMATWGSRRPVISLGTGTG